jgi:hypothetical protein
MVDVGTKEPQGGEVDGKVPRDVPGQLVREHCHGQRREASEAEAWRKAPPPSEEYLGPETKRPIRTTPLGSGVVYYRLSWDR